MFFTFYKLYIPYDRNKFDYLKTVRLGERKNAQIHICILSRKENTLGSLACRFCNRLLNVTCEEGTTMWLKDPKFVVTPKLLIIKLLIIHNSRTINI